MSPYLPVPEYMSQMRAQRVQWRTADRHSLNALENSNSCRGICCTCPDGGQMRTVDSLSSSSEQMLPVSASAAVACPFRTSSVVLSDGMALSPRSWVSADSCSAYGHHTAM